MSDSVDLNETEQEALEAAVNEIESQDDEAANDSNDSNPLPEEHSPLALQQEGDRGMEAAEATPGWKQELENAGF